MGKTIAQDKTQKPKDEGKKPHTQSERGGSSEGRQYDDINTLTMRISKKIRN